MRYHGSVSLILLAISTTAFGQEPAIPRLLGSPDPQQQLDARAIPRSPAASPIVGPTGNQSLLENELEALRSDLQSFHAVSQDVARSARDLEGRSDRVSIQQRQELLDLLTRIATQGIARKAAREAAAQIPQPDPVALGAKESGNTLAITDATVDAFALGKVLFKSGDFAKAEQAFRRVVPSDDNRDLLKYMIATCQYRRKLIPQAMQGYKELAASNDDPVIRDLAKFQLDGIRWRQEIDQELEQLRKQREKHPGGAIPKPETDARN